MENKLIGYADDSTLMAVIPTPGDKVTVVKSPISDLGRVNLWCHLCGMKLNASKTKTMIVSRLCRMHPLSPPLTIGGTVLKESDDLVILGLTLDSKLTFEKHLHLVSKAPSQRLGILRKSCRVLHNAPSAPSAPGGGAPPGAPHLGVWLIVTLLIVDLLQFFVCCIR